MHTLFLFVIIGDGLLIIENRLQMIGLCTQLAHHAQQTTTFSV